MNIISKFAVLVVETIIEMSFREFVLVSTGYFFLVWVISSVIHYGTC